MKPLLKLGFADTIITPPKPTQVFMDGYGSRLRPAEGVHDDLHAKVCAICSDESVFLLYSLDLVGLRPNSYRLITDQIHDILGIDRSAIALCCIHTHAGPVTGLLDELPLDTDYIAYIGECCALAGKRAIERACPGTLRFEILPELFTESVNRRSGREVIDRTIRAVAFRDEECCLRGVLCTAACHAVANTSYLLSADWLCVLNRLSSDELPYLFFQGRCGDINPIMDMKLPLDQRLDRIGASLADPVSRFAQNAPIGEPTYDPMTFAYETVRIPMMHLTDTDALREKIKQLTSTYLSFAPDNTQKHYTLRSLQWHRHMLRIAENNLDFDLHVPLQYLAIGKTCIFAFIPFELFTLTGNKLEEIFLSAGFPREGIYLCGYANLTQGYLPAAEEFEFGGYEVNGSQSWYNISRTIPESEAAVLNWFTQKAHSLR